MISENLKFLKLKARVKKIFNSKNFNKLRQEAIEHGSLPYKILKYKRITTPEKTPIPLVPDSYVTPDSFEAQIKYLSKESSIISLNQLIELIENNKKIPERTVVLTIDYSHMDSYLYAFPILLKNQINATFFTSSGYLENNTFLYNDRLVLSLINIRAANKLLPKEYDFLPADIREQAQKISPNGEVSAELIDYLTVEMAVASSKDRLALMNTIALFKDIPSLIEYEDFMRWEDLKHIQSSGFSIGNMGHFSIANTDIEVERFKADIGHSITEYEKNQIEIIPTFCIPDTAITEARYQALSELGCRYIVNELFYPEPKFQTKLPMILSRKSISEFNSPSIEFFACHIWDIDISD